MDEPYNRCPEDNEALSVGCKKARYHSGTCAWWARVNGVYTYVSWSRVVH